MSNEADTPVTYICHVPWLTTLFTDDQSQLTRSSMQTFKYLLSSICQLLNEKLTQGHEHVSKLRNLLRIIATGD